MIPPTLQKVASHHGFRRLGKGQPREIGATTTNSWFLVLERNNRGVGVGGGFGAADREFYRIDTAGASDVSLLDLDAAKRQQVGAVPRPRRQHRRHRCDGDDESVGKSREKWEGLPIGPRLNDGGYLLLAGTDNDYSVTQSATGMGFDVWVDVDAIDRYARSIQSPLGQPRGCTFTAAGAAALWNPALDLLPSVLHSYRTGAGDLATCTTLLPESAIGALLFAALGVMRAVAGRRKPV